MSYAIVYGQGALDQLLQLDGAEIVDCVESHMNQLASDPIALSRPGKKIFPLPDGAVFRPQEFEFHCPNGPGQTVHFRVYFHFEQTERELQVIGIVPKPYLAL